MVEITSKYGPFQLTEEEKKVVEKVQAEQASRMAARNWRSITDHPTFLKAEVNSALAGVGYPRNKH